jgi:alpha-amylase
VLIGLDLWDLGEFHQNGTTRTKWGTLEDLKNLSKVAQHHNVFLYFDAVLNHKASADATEKCRAIQVEWDGDITMFSTG